MSTEHTPGPWSYGLGYRIRPDRGTDKHGREIGGPTIAVVNADGDRCCPPPDEIEANGRLIAAAPDLLTACRIMLPLLEHTEKCEASADDGYGLRLRTLRQNLQTVRNALAKAEGKT